MSLITCCVVLFFALIIGKLFFIQVVAHDAYREAADRQHLAIADRAAKRGEIYVRDHAHSEAAALYPLAANKIFYHVFVNPNQITQPVHTAEVLHGVLGVDYDLTLSRVKKEGDAYEPIKSKVPFEQVEELKKAGLPGIHYREEIWRHYPDQDVGSHILGFFAIDGAVRKGQYGLEGYWNAMLSGQDRATVVARDSRGAIIPETAAYLTDATHGASLLLTIDRTIQYKACEVIKRGIERYAADNGSIVIMESTTGKILALCNYPSFDPNIYNQVPDVNVFNNNAVFDAYEPGSIMKPIAFAIAIDQEKILPTSVYEDTGEVTVGGRTIRNFNKQAHGIKNMTEVLQESLNTGIVFATKNVENRTFYEYIKKFGFGEKTGIELSQESAGSLGALGTLQDIYKATVSFGQGISATPMQLVAAVNVLATGGVLMKPYIVEEVRNADGSVTRTLPVPIRQVVKRETAQTMSAMMTRVLEQGYDRKGSVDGYYLAGKTGTAQIAERGAYGSKTNHSFIGFGPSDDPKFTALIRMHNVKNVGFAADSTTPLFHDIAQFMLQYYRIAPSR